MSRITLVTGSASGIGAAIAAAFAAQGDTVIGADIAYAGFARGEDMVRARCDVSDTASVDAMVDTVEAELGPVEVLVNNAGIYPMQPFETITPEDWNRVIATNLGSVFNLCRRIVPAMKAAQRGRIINIVSNTFFMGTPNLAHYVASKGAIIGLSRSLAAELGSHGIAINCVAPNFTRTEGTAIVERMAPAIVEATVAMQSIPRVSEPRDIVGAVLFLASAQAGFITGQTLVVDGGGVKH